MWGIALRLLGLAAVVFIAESCGSENGGDEETPDVGGDTPPNHPPQCGNNPDIYVHVGDTISAVLKASDPDGDSLTYNPLYLPDGASLSTSGLFSWRPSSSQAGQYTIPVAVSDGTAITNCEVAVTVQGSTTTTNQSPVINPISNQTVQEGQPLSFTVSASDQDGTAPTLSASPLPNGSTFNPLTGVFQWTPNFSQAGTYPVVFSATDGQATVTKIVNIQVQNTNQPPILNSIPSKTVMEGQPDLPPKN